MKGEIRQGKRTWIKLHTMECLEGSIRYQLEADERGVWYDLLVFSAVCRNDGIISDRDGRAFPHSFIANRLNIPLELLERTLSKCGKEGRLKEDKTGIVILNWAVYQSEYSRLKKYRVREKAEPVPPLYEDDPSGVVDRKAYYQEQVKLGRDPRRAPYETQKMFEERLALCGAPKECPADWKEQSDKIMEGVLGGKGVAARGNTE